ncbi:hypothetical protein AVU12_gp076 [Pseudomonas phage KPP21]|uniref:AAA+ ATPase domain-containing protein n=1 Tax=Pseudomonas phage KPP21 TaxID=1678082 RepID=A0A0H5B125_BPK21|nr:hypothetical protein AVU12_gp076 [Pseudomonas phage KPP21]BAR94635.1 hypothetical protein [Pseudomonas phage KPP21]
MTNINASAIESIRRCMTVHMESIGTVRPHFILTGSSGAGKSYTVQAIAEELDLRFVEINCAQLTKEGLSGNSLAKEMAAVKGFSGVPSVVFADEFDKLLIAGNSNSELAHESTAGVQNEFLKMLESDITKVYGDYGKYQEVNVGKVLFIFAGAFNGVDMHNLDDLRAVGVKNEFLGRVPLHFHLEKPTLDDLLELLNRSALMEGYLELFSSVKRDTARKAIAEAIKQGYDSNTLGVRFINTLVHQYFIEGGFQAKKPSQKRPVRSPHKQPLDFSRGAATR